MSKVITATFKTPQAIERVLIELEAAGLTEEQLSLVMTDDTRGNSFTIDEHNKADEGTAAGATFGGVVGAILGAVFAGGAIAVPGLNLIVSGALAGGLAGLGAGAASGGIIGMLIGMGVPEHEAKLYQEELTAGNILLAVKPRDGDQRKNVERILNKADAYNIAA